MNAWAKNQPIKSHFSLTLLNTNRYNKAIRGSKCLSASNSLNEKPKNSNEAIKKISFAVSEFKFVKRKANIKIPKVAKNTFNIKGNKKKTV